MISKTLAAASTKPLVLTILRSGENYGYQIIQSVRRISGGHLEWSEPMLYPLLQRMERDGFVKSSWKITEKKRLRKYYRLTDKGVKEQEKEKEQWFLISRLFSRLLEDEMAAGVK
ncbi:MAG: helix-turn-helix transcriptional regulator [Candidatus Aminicenantes bacterium]|nr:helix-turn-helix transcriptional regulator [Candidatus Aminicenantes bacterium]